MRAVPWPSFLRYTQPRFYVAAHSIGGDESTRQNLFGRGAGARWVGALNTVPLSPADGRRARAWLHSLRGQSGSFMYAPLTTATATTTAVFGSITGDALAVTGIGVPALVKVGAFLTVVTPRGTQLVQCVAVVSGGGTAAQTIRIRPRLRATPAAAAVVTIGAVSLECRLAGATPRVPLRGDRALGFTLEFEEMY